MAIQAAQIAVGTSPVALTGSISDATGHSIVVQAPASATLYIGPAGVTSTNGFPVAAGSSITGDLESGESLYGVLASGSGTAYVLRSGV